MTAFWAYIIWAIVGVIAGILTRKFSKRVSGFGKIGDGIIGALGGILGGSISTAMLSSTLTDLLLSILAAIIGAIITVSVVKFITHPS